VDDLAPGESVACSGACLTVVERGGGVVSFDAVPETLARTTLGGWGPGTKVNLERALALGDRLGGHIVQGHVDAVGEVLRRTPEGQGVRLTVSLPSAIASLVAEKGSIAVDGVSLTVAAAGRDRFELALIPETLARTTLGDAAPGVKVNLEADLIARHVARLRELAAAGPGAEAPGAGLGAGDLARWGYPGGGGA
jgi:riboflavin synthase